MKNKYSLDDYPQYRRVFPNLRLSWTLYQKWFRDDWDGIRDYFLDIPSFRNKAMEKGREIHKRIEENADSMAKKIGIDETKETYGMVQIEEKFILETDDDYSIVIIPDMLSKDYIIDFKTGKTSLSAYENQIHLYNYVLKKMKKGSKLYARFGGKDLGCDFNYDFDAALLVKVDENLDIKRKQMIILNEEKAKALGYEFEEMAEDIKMKISNGLLES